MIGITDVSGSPNITWAVSEVGIPSPGVCVPINSGLGRNSRIG